MSAKQLSAESFVIQLKAISFQKGKEIELQKTTLIRQLSENPPRKPAEIMAYHDCLQSMLAYPADRKIYSLTCIALEGLKDYLKNKLAVNNTRLSYALSGTGLSGSSIIGSFSFEIVKWLCKEFPQDVEIESSLADPESVRLFFREILPRTEYENIFTGELSLLRRCYQLKGKSPGSILNWLLYHIDSLQIPERDKESVFHNLQIFIHWRLKHPVYNRTMLLAGNRNIFYHKEIKRQADINKIIGMPLPEASALTEKEKQHFVNTAKATLLFLHRETEPFTYADTDEITCFELERGLSVVLYGMSKERRLSIESYVGYLALKNGVPVAYGGGWIFGHRCQFGINILPAFRGGESALVFYQLLRVYKQHFGAERFVVKPYQFGKNNEEALKSGAFWFYYRAGFRPEDENLKQLASDEWNKLHNDRQYRTPVSLLKKFIVSNLELQFLKNAFPHYDASAISTSITDFINDYFGGKRDNAVNACIKQTKKQLGIKSLSGWNEYDRKALKEWSLLAQALLHTDRWSIKQKEKFITLIKAKGSSQEISFVKLLQQHQKFWEDADQALISKSRKNKLPA